jgi:hypothetical protein
MVSFEEAKNLHHGQVLYHITKRNADGTAQRWRVNGKVKLWKTRPTEIRVPIKWGLKVCDYLDQTTLDLLVLTDPTQIL